MLYTTEFNRFLSAFLGRLSEITDMRIIIVISLLLLTLTGCPWPEEDDFYYNYTHPKIAMDGSGNAVLVGVEVLQGELTGGTQAEISSWHYDSDEGWLAGRLNLGEPFNPFEEGADGIPYPQIAMDASGSAIAVWIQSEIDRPSRIRLYANHYVLGSGWGEAELISLDPVEAFYGGRFFRNPAIAMDGAGRAIAVWSEASVNIDEWFNLFKDGPYNLYTNRYVPGNGWEGAQLIESNEETAAHPQIAMNAGGVAIAIWEQGSDIYTNRYVIGSGWEGEQLIGSGMGNSGSDYSFPQIAMHINGVNANAIAVWEGKDSPSIYANRYVVGSGWEGAQLINKSGGSNPKIAMDAGGIAIVVWAQDKDIYANRYVPGSGWEGEEAIGGRNDGSLPKIAMDADGYAIALWQRWNDSYGGNDLYTNRYVPGSGWEGAQLIAPGEWDHQTPRIAMDDSGTAIVVWEQDNVAGEGTTIKSYVFNINETTTTTAPYSTTTTTVQNGDGFTLTVIDTITVGEDPRGIAVNSETNRIYVANVGSDDVSVIDGSTNEVIATVEVGGGPYSVGVNPATNKIYVVSDTLSVIDGSTNEVLSTIQLSYPGNVAVNPETNRIYVGNRGQKGISVIDGALDEVIETIEVGYLPEKLDVNLKTNRIYVLTDLTNVTVIDGDSNDVVTTIEVEANPRAIGVNSETDRIYVTNTTSDTVAVIDGSANEIITSIEVGDNPTGVGIHPAANHVYIVCAMSGEVIGIDGSSNEIKTTAYVDGIPGEVGVNPATNRIYVNGGSEVTVIAVE